MKADNSDLTLFYDRYKQQGSGQVQQVSQPLEVEVPPAMFLIDYAVVILYQHLGVTLSDIPGDVEIFKMLDQLKTGK